MSILKNVIVIILLTMLGHILFAQDKTSNITIFPQIAHPGDTITISYNAASSNLALMTEVKAFIAKYTSKGKGKLEVITLEKKDSLWIGKFISKKNELSYLITFISGTVLDYKYKDGFPLILFGNDAFPLPEAYATIADASNRAKKNMGGDDKLALRLYKLEFMLHPNSKRKYFLNYLSSKTNLGLTSKDSLLTELNEFCKREDFSANELSEIGQLYGKLGDNATHEKFNKQALEKDKTGEIAKKMKWEDFESAIDLNKKLEIFEEFEKSFSDQIISFKMSAYIATIYASQNNVTELVNFLLKYPKSNTSRVYNLIATILADTNIEISKDFVLKGYNQTKNKISSSNNTPNTLLNIELAESANLLGYLLSTQNKYNEALLYFKEADKIEEAKALRLPKVFNQYMITLMKTNSPEAAPIIDSLLRIGRATEEMKSFLKNESGQKSGKSEFKQYADSIETANNKSMKRVVEQKIMNKPAAEFTLKDLEGKNVSLSDFKGKTVVLDFWGTWCGPCIASFPAMQKVIEAYKADKNVVFLMIDSRERVENRTKVVTDFMNKRGYKFNNLIDEKDDVAKAFQIEAFPTKLVIDKQGNIRFTSRGYDNNEAGLITELSLMIEQIK